MDAPATGIFSFPNELLMDIQECLDTEDTLELRTTMKLWHAVCNGGLKTIHIRGSFPSALRMVEFNGDNFHPKVIEFERDVTFEMDLNQDIDFIRKFGSKCQNLNFSSDPGDDILVKFLELLPRVDHVRILDSDRSFCFETEAAKRVVSRLKFFNLNEIPGGELYSGFPRNIKSMTNLKNIYVPEHFKGWTQSFEEDLFAFIAQQAPKLNSLCLQKVDQSFYERLCQIPNLHLKKFQIGDEMVAESFVMDFLKLQPKLEVLEVWMQPNWSVNVLNTIVKLCPRLKGLTIFYVNNFDQPFDFSFLEAAVMQLKRLEVISDSIKCDSGYHALGLDSIFPQVKKLMIYCGYLFCTDCCYKMVKAFPNIRKVQTNVFDMDERSFKAIFANTHLTELSLTVSGFLDMVEDTLIVDPCMSLRRLTIENDPAEDNEFGAEWVKYLPQMPNLKNLYVKTDEFSIDTLGDLIEKCPRLTELRLRYCAEENVSRILLFPLRNLRVFCCDERKSKLTWSYVPSWPNLRYFDVPHLNIDEKILENIFNEMPNLIRITGKNLIVRRRI